VQLVSISLDPERDTPEVLKQYADKMKADQKRWHFLTGDKMKILPAAVGIHAVEAYHAGLIRTTIAGLDAQAGNTTLSGLTQKISAARAKLANPSGTPVDDVGVTTVSVALNGSSNNYTAATLVNADANSIGWSRTTTQILAIVTGGSSGNKGVFFPAGLNGIIK